MPASETIRAIHVALEQPSDDNSEPSILVPYLSFGRWLPLAISPFLDLDLVLTCGACHIAPDEERDADALGTFKRIANLSPKMCKLIESFDDLSYLPFCRLVKKLTKAANDGRTDDTSSLKYGIREYIPIDPEKDPPVAPGIPMPSIKSIRGFSHPQLARLLCPLSKRREFDKDPQDFMDKVKNGTIRLRASQWPSFLYPHNAVFNPSDRAKGLFCGHVFLRVLRHIFTGPSSGISKFRAASKPSKGEIHGMKEVTGRHVAYAALQTYFALCSIESWSSEMRDAYFQPFAFFHNCVTIFEDQPNSVWVQETLAYLTNELPSLARQSKLKRGRAMLSDSEGDTSENEFAATLEQQRVEEDDDFDPPPPANSSSPFHPGTNSRNLSPEGDFTIIPPPPRNSSPSLTPSVTPQVARARRATEPEDPESEDGFDSIYVPVARKRRLVRRCL